MVRRPPGPPADRRPDRGQGRRDPRSDRPRLRAADPGVRGHLHRAGGGDPLACSTRTSSSRSADVQGDHDTLRAAIEDEGWPDVDDLRGRFVFTLDDTQPQARPVPGAAPRHPRSADLRVGRSRPTTTPPSRSSTTRWPTATAIRSSSQQGYLVRTRTDADTVEARAGRHHPPRGGLRQRRPDREHRLRARRTPASPASSRRCPAAAAARCNPVSAPADCNDDALRRVAATIRRCRRSVAQRVSSWRLLSWSLRSTADTWVSTVFTDRERPPGDLLVGVAPGDEAHHLALARAELVELRVADRRWAGRRRRRRARSPASRGENTASPSRTRMMAAASSSDEIDLVT